MATSQPQSPQRAGVSTHGRRNRALTIDIKKFSYGGTTPEFDTFESELKRQIDSDDNSSTDSDNEESGSGSEEVAPPPDPDDAPLIDTAVHTPTSELAASHKRRKVAFAKDVDESKDKPSSAAKHRVKAQSVSAQTFMRSKKAAISRRTRMTRARSQTKGHINKMSFAHYRIESIMINVGAKPTHNMVYSDDEEDEASQSPAANHSVIFPSMMMKAMTGIIPEDGDDEDEDEADEQPVHGHQSVGTTLIDGHPPLPSLPQSRTNESTANERRNVAETETETETGTESNMSPARNRLFSMGSADPQNGTVPSSTKGAASDDAKEEEEAAVIESRSETLIEIDPSVQFIEKEIIETEETYYRGLNTLLNELLRPIFDQKLVNPKYEEQCICNLPELLEFHDTLLSQLVEAYEYSNNIQSTTKPSYTSISQVFTAQNKEDFISLYLDYIHEYNSILDLFGNKFHKNAKLQAFLKQKRQEKKPLTNFLILPVQRIPRYGLLLSDLKKHTKTSDPDYENVGLALQTVEEIANEINERERKIENMSQCLQIQEALTNLTESIVHPDRHYQKQFVFVKKSNKHQRQLFCFNDIVIVTNANWVVKDILDVRTLDVKLASDKKKNNKSKKKKKELTEFTLLYSNSKPCKYISKTMDDIKAFDELIKQNRLNMIDSDLAQSNDTLGIREALKEQGVSQSDDYNQEVSSKRSKRRRGNAKSNIFGGPLGLQ